MLAGHVHRGVRRIAQSAVDVHQALGPESLPLPSQPGGVHRAGRTTKQPGARMLGNDIEMLVVHNADGEEMTAYERLLGDAMRGDATLFAREDAVEAAWSIVDPVLGDVVPVDTYHPNTWGPDCRVDEVTPPGGWHNPVPDSALPPASH